MRERKQGQKSRRRKKMCLAWAACVCMLFIVPDTAPAALTQPMRVSATAGTSLSTASQSIREKQDQISQIQEERNNLKNGLSDLQKMRDELKEARTDLKNYISRLDSNLSQIEQNISDLKIQLSEKQDQIEQTAAELTEAQEIEKNQKEMMTWHIRLLYEQGSSHLVESLFHSTSFGEFLNRLDYINQVATYEQNMLEEYKANVEYIALCVEQLELERDVLEQTRAAVEAEQNNLEELIDQKNRDITNYDTDIATKEQAIKEYEDMIAQQDAEIKALEAAIAEERRRALANNGDVLHYDNGIFKFPLASYTRISDEYGPRIHPTLGVEQFHNGVDFAAPKGTAIYAAYDGKVVAAEYSESMGNYVMIDHGDSLYTIYMHASALYVSKGDVVVRGDHIAAVGATGRATGNHLHFSVRLNGEYVSPWNYLSP